MYSRDRADALVCVNLGRDRVKLFRRVTSKMEREVKVARGGGGGEDEGGG